VLIDGPDCKLWVEVRGEGEPVTVFGHGITSSVAEISAFSSKTPGTRVLFDFRGHGRSESPPAEAGYDVRAMRRDLEAVAGRYGATRAMGTSMGAATILSVLADDPNRFERAVLFIPAWIFGDAHPGEHGYHRLAELLETKPLEEVADALTEAPENQPLFSARGHWRDLVRWRVMRMNATGVPRALRAYSTGSPPVGDPERLRRVEIPVLILAHEGDPIHDAETARRLAEILPNARLQMWPAPLAMLDDLPAFARLIGDFLGGDDAA
jgi:pimeloyl-ACP methyl ester carboxylesterase